ncbi:efflux ABC transporter permease domain containing protein [Entamoeba histolytica KU27]|uniref:Efflux ABC transporter permease domain containing protein n=1 Tax=Entamoeba histolytica KU27 TaxID=885311 RepID=M2S1A4_ENTHI|nr:efflux ABC transporter permease domain containing protein [Entamoeba histolytica KU27]
MIHKICHFLTLCKTNIIRSIRLVRTSYCNYCIGCCSVSVVFVITCTLLSILSTTPLVYLRLSEQKNGQIDMIITPSSDSGGIVLNFTEINKVVHTATPRWIGSAKFFSGDCSFGFEENDNDWIYYGNSSDIHENCELDECFTKYCSSSRHVSGSLIALKTKQEKQIGLGEKWGFEPLKENEIYLPRRISNQLLLKEGDELYVSISNETVYPLLIEYHDIISNQYLNNSEPPRHFILKLKLKGSYDSDEGKFGGKEQGILEFDFFIKTIQSNIPRHLTNLNDYLDKLNMNEYCDQIIVNVPTPREKYYLSNDYNNLQNEVTTYLSNVLLKLGYQDLQSSTPVLSELSQYKYVNVILGMIVEIAIIVLLVLSILLVHSLLTINIESQQHSIRIQRTIGATRLNLTFQLFVNSLFYAIPSLITGSILSTIIFFFVSLITKPIFSIPITFLPSTKGIFVAIFLTFLVPIISIIFPLYSVLHRTLTTRPSTVLEITIKRSNTSYFSPLTVFIGLFTTCFGFSTYILLPRSILALNLSTMFTIFSLLIICLLVGSILLIINIIPIIERLLLYLFYFWDTAGLSLTIKNLLSHKARNKKTSLLFALSLGFILFFYSSFTSEIGTLSQTIIKSKGTEMYIVGLKSKFNTTQELNEAMRSVMEKAEGLEEVLGVTLDFDGIDQVHPKYFGMSTLGQGVILRENYVAILPTTFEVMNQKFLKVKHRMNVESVGDMSDSSIGKIMYTSNGLYKVIMGTNIKELSYADDKRLLVCASTNPERTNVLGVMGLFTYGVEASSTPKYTLSDSPLLTWQDLLISLPEYVRYTNGYITSIDEIPITRIYLKLIDSTEDTANKVKQKLVTSKFDAIIVASELSGIRTIQNIMVFYFVFVTVVALATSFFSILSSMYSNIEEQKHEIAVLRAIGVGRFLLLRTYLAESFVVIFSASLMGMIIGSLIGFTMTLQIILFTQTPVEYTFPTLLLIIVVISAILFALISTVLPLIPVLKKQPMELLRETNE